MSEDNLMLPSEPPAASLRSASLDSAKSRGSMERVVRPHFKVELGGAGLWFTTLHGEAGALYGVGTGHSPVEALESLIETLPTVIRLQADEGFDNEQTRLLVTVQAALVSRPNGETK